jgi:hypothetical protein
VQFVKQAQALIKIKESKLCPDLSFIVSPALL